MFGTLRYEPQSDIASFHPGVGTPQHSACDTCRGRKLKCGGQKPGCVRCESNSIQCVYSDTGNGNRRRGKGGAASRQGNKASPQNLYTTSPSSRNSAAPYARSKKGLGSSSQSGPNTEQGDAGSKSSMLPEKSAMFSPLSSSLPPFDNSDRVISDHTMHDFLPDLSPGTMDECLSMPQYPDLMSLDDYNYLPLNFYPTPEHNSSSSEGARSSSLQELNSYTFINTAASQPEAPEKEEQHRPRQHGTSTESFRPPSSASSATNRPPQRSHFPPLPPPHASEPPEPRLQSATKLYPPQPRSNDNNMKKTAPCKCLQTILSLLEGLEDRAATNGGHEQTLDSILAYQKEALRRCLRVVHCPTCTARPDHLILLGVVSDKLIANYENVLVGGDMDSSMRNGRRGSNSHRDGSIGMDVEEEDDQEEEDTHIPAGDGGGRGKSSSSSSSLSSKYSHATAKGRPQDGDTGGGGGTNPLGPRQPLYDNMSFGCYKVDNQLEWEYVVRVLMTLQLRQVLGLLASMQRIAEGSSRGAQIAAIKVRRRRLEGVIERMRGRGRVQGE